MRKDLVGRLRSTFCCDGIAICNCDESADEIERLRAALRRISHAPIGKVYCADGHEEAVLIARVALEGEASDDAAT